MKHIQQYTLNRLILICTVIIYLAILLSFTLAPFEVTMIRFNMLRNWSSSGKISYLFHPDFPDILSNLLLFVPLGVMIRLYESGKNKDRWIIPVLLAFALSSSIEFSQMFLNRATSVIDLVMNTISCYLGFRFAGAIMNHLVLPVNAAILRNRKRRCILTLFFTGMIIALFLYPLRLNRPANWSNDYHLMVGNESDGKRQWQGTIYFVQIFDRALTEREILNPSDLHHGLIANYRFSSLACDTVMDHSHLQNPMILNPDGDYILQPDGGLTIRKGTITSERPAVEMTRAIRSSSAFTVQMRVRTDNFQQYGPARIVSLSKGPDLRNFTVGQERNGIHFRVRTYVTGWNGSKITLKVDDVFTDHDPHLLTLVFNRGMERLYIDGKPVRPMLRSHIYYLPKIMFLGRNSIAQFALIFLLFAPASILLHGCFSRRPGLRTVFILSLLALSIELFYVLTIHQPFSPMLTATAAGFSIFGSFYQSLLNTHHERSGVRMKPSLPLSPY